MKYTSKLIQQIFGGFVLLMLFSLVSMPSLSAQDDQWPEFEEKKERRTTYISKKYKRNALSTYWGGIDIGINGYMNDGDFNLTGDLDALELNYGRSIELNINLVEQQIDLYKNFINITYGPDLTFNWYNFTNDITLVPGPDMVTIVEENIEFDNNRLYNFGISIPVMLNFQTGHGYNNNNFRVGVGAYGGVLLTTNQRQKFDGTKVKVKDDFNQNKFHGGLRAELGIGPVNFYTTYSLSTFFKEGEGPDLNRFSIGLSLFRWE
ncbi:MAG: hypothetical protein AAFV80_04545 [Bacteroidota bacterium]